MLQTRDRRFASFDQTVPMAVKEKDFSDNPYLLQTSCQRMEEKHLFYCQIDWIRLTRYQTKCLNLYDVVSTNESHEIYENWPITSSHVIYIFQKFQQIHQNCLTPYCLFSVISGLARFHATSFCYFHDSKLQSDVHNKGSLVNTFRKFFQTLKGEYKW